MADRFPEGQVVPLDAYPTSDDEVAAFVARTGAPGIVDIHVHAMPDRLQQAVWRYFDGLTDPPWPIRYRDDLETRLGQLRAAGVVAHTALAYAHQPGMLAWLNDFTLGLARRHPHVVPTFTLYPQEDVTRVAADAVERGGVVCKVHNQLSRFTLDDPRLDDAWRLLSDARTVVVAHTSQVYGVDGGEATSGGSQIHRVRERHPELRLCIAHLGLPDPDGAHWDAITSLEHVWTDTSGVLTEPPLSYGPAGTGDELPHDAIRARLTHHAVFGSDFPSIPYRYHEAVRGLWHLQPDPAVLRELLHDRAARLLADAGWTVTAGS